MSKELRPCPFCGGTKICTEKGLNINYCDNCSAESNVGHWNTRPIEDDLRKRISELEGKLAELIEAADKMYGVTEYILGGDTVEMFYCREIAEEARDVLKVE